MFGGTFQALVMASVAAAFGLLDRVLTQRYDPARTGGGTATTWRYMLSSALLAVGLVAQPLLWPQLTLTLPAPWGCLLQLTGVGLAALALGLNAWARVRLGVFYAQRAEVQPGHRVIDDGPYAWMRHPIFSAYFLVSTGLLLVVPSLPMLLVALYTYVLFTRTSLRDERLLARQLPGYPAYMARTPRFFPRLFSRPAGFGARQAGPQPSGPEREARS